MHEFYSELFAISEPTMPPKIKNINHPSLHPSYKRKVKRWNPADFPYQHPRFPNTPFHKLLKAETSLAGIHDPALRAMFSGVFQPKTIPISKTSSSTSIPPITPLMSLKIAPPPSVKSNVPKTIIDRPKSAFRREISAISLQPAFFSYPTLPSPIPPMLSPLPPTPPTAPVNQGVEPVNAGPPKPRQKRGGNRAKR